MQKTLVAVLNRIESNVIGKPHECRLALACLLAQGHLLIEDLPGMGKTTLAKTLANTLSLSYQRTQFTSDLLPSDIVGISIFNSETKQFELHQGPIFNQVILGDEINRASPKTQSALLEAMAENQVSIDGITHQLPKPFFVIATQNPLFYAGTYPLPESQLDRFMMKISLGFPSIEAEKNILLADELTLTKEKELPELVNTNSLVTMQNTVQEVYVSDNVIEYIIALCRISRGQYVAEKEEQIECKPLSPRAGKALLSAAKAWAFIDGRDFVLPDDVKAVFYNVCEHRLEQNIMESNQGAKSISAQIIDIVNILNPLNV